jgi:uncharacterized membrane protein HdeD (DUF308 family)
MLQLIARRWWVVLLRGLAAIALGITAFVAPITTMIALVLVFAAFSIIDGAAAIVLGIRGEPDGTIWWTMIFLGVLAIAAGIAAFLLPGTAVVALLIVIAVSAIVRGVFEIAAAVALRKEIEGEWILALSGVLSISFGVLLMLRPNAGALAVIWIIGAYMTALGVVAVVLSLRLRSLAQKLPPQNVPSGP